MKAATTLLLISVFGLVVLGIVTLVSASMGLPQARFAVMQPLWAAIGLVGCLLGATLNYRWLRKVWWIFALGVVVLLFCVWLPKPIGVHTLGSSRWINLGGFHLQPSELAKVALILGLAWYGERYRRVMPQFGRGVLLPMAGAMVLLGLIYLEPDKGTTAFLGALTCILLAMAGARWRHILGLVCVAAVCLVVDIANNSNRSQRVHAWLNPQETLRGKGMQAYQAKAAFGSGGLTGVGLGEGRQKLGFIPVNTSDFILSIIGEELGLVGTLSVIAAYLSILVCGVYIAWHAADTFGMLLASGITFLITLQAAINIGVVTGALPNKGIALPFLSYGGSNLVVMMGCVGLLLSVARLASAPASLPARDLESDDLSVPHPA